jgi:type II secretory pathway predicted ATPase ExeA
MYETSFKFHSRPFPPTPNTDTYFPVTVIERARQTLTRLIERGEGPGLIIGTPGTGKTLLCQLLGEQFQDRFAVVLLSSGRLKSCRAMLQVILYELGLPYRDSNEGELRLTLLDFLEPKPGGSQGLLLLVDEAHTLPWRLLDELRLMTNLVRDGQPRVRVIMAGASVLEERFASPKLGSFNQRVAGRCYLEALDGAETAEYVRAQIAAAGGDPAKLVDDETMRSICRVSEGIPRLINQVCDHAFVLASLGGERRLSSEAIEEAWADLQQLPPPWIAPPEGQAAASQVVEFGNLDDDLDDAPEAIPFRGVEKPPVAQPLSGPLDSPAPEEQLASIAEKLSTIYDVEEPRAAADTAADLDFPEFGDPFQERFAEEEVVVDPYGPDVEIFADVPRVSSWEGQQLSSLLYEADAAQPWPKSEPRPNVKINEPSVADADEQGAFAPSSDPVLPEETPVESLAEAESPGGQTVPDEATAPAHPQPLDKLSGVANDRDVIVLEEDSPKSVPGPTAAAPERKAEFRQLFAKLRRG